MEIKSKPHIEASGDGFRLIFDVDISEADNLYNLINSIETGNVYELKIKKKEIPRSQNANAYAWQLIKILSKELGIPPIEIYQQQIYNMCCYYDELVPNNHLAQEIKEWRSQGYGWLTEIIPSDEEEYTMLRRYIGSSSFNSKEMSLFIDNLIQELKPLGLQVDSKEYVEQIKSTHRKRRKNVEKL